MDAELFAIAGAIAKSGETVGAPFQWSDKAQRPRRRLKEEKDSQCMMAKAESSAFVGEAPPHPFVFHFIYNRASVGGMGVEVLAMAGSWRREGDALPRYRSDGPIR